MTRMSLPALVLLLLVAPPAAAQSNKGGLNGTVFDETGAVVAGATVVITNIGTSQAQEVKTSAAGTFSAPLLDPVEYRVTADHPGFRTTTVASVKVDTATTATLKMTLKLATVASEVSVSAEAPQIDRASGTAGQTITERQIVEMPL